MSVIQVCCPHCGFSREVAAEKIPDQPVQVTCPKCKQIFQFDKSQASAPDAPPMVSPDPGEPPVTPPPQEAMQNSVAPPPPLPEPAVSGPQELLAIGALFSSVWELFKQRWLLLLGIMLATVVAIMSPPMLAAVVLAGSAKGSFSGLVSFIMGMGIAVILALLIACWGMAAVMNAAVDTRLGFKESFERAKGNWIALAWVSTLYSFIVGGASLLFIIPGVLTGIWFFASGYLVVAEDVRGMEALLKSKALVQGRFWPVFGRLVLVWLLGMILGMVPLIGPLLSLLFAPFSMLFSVRLYQDLHETSGSISWAASDGTKAGWLLLGLAGYLLVPLLIFSVVGAAFVNEFFMPILKLLSQPGKSQQITAGYELLSRLW